MRALSGVVAGVTAVGLTAAAVVAVCSMVGMIPTVGFIAKEGVLTAMLDTGVAATTSRPASARPGAWTSPETT